MDRKIIYSIIIPHKNIPLLLQRCLDSIPQWEDIQVIVVDDNSSSEIVDFSNFPGQNRAGVEIVFTKEGRGAGYARNCGLERAKGKWLIFADADDFFNPCFALAIDSYRDTTYDQIFFLSNSVDSDTLQPVIARQSYLKEIEDGDYNSFRYKTFVPWAKMFSANMVKKYHLRFDETVAANDVMFVTYADYYSKNIATCVQSVYCSTVRMNSLWYGMAYSSLLARVSVSARFNCFMKSLKLDDKRVYTYAWVARCKRIGLKAYLGALFVYLRFEPCRYINEDFKALVKAKLYK